MIKLIIFDLDGVLVDSPDMHYQTFSQAFFKYSGVSISKKEHDINLNGRSTHTKLKILKERDHLTDELCEEIWNTKQRLTFDYINKNLEKDDVKINLLSALKKNYKLACASNAIKQTIINTLTKLEIIEYFDCILSNEDVNDPKPSASIYLKAMIELNCNPSNTLIIEDSKVGYEGALATRAEVLRVINAEEVTYKKIAEAISKIENKPMKQKYTNTKLNVVIPMAGAGSRFETAGYTFPKPLIEIEGKTMIQLVCECLNIEANFIFIARKEHDEKYNIKAYLKNLINNSEVILTDGLTEGAACTALLAKDYINNNDPILFANSDQYVKWDVYDFIKKVKAEQYDGCMLTFNSTHPKWSFAKVDENGLVTEVAEKKPISNIATVGVYYWNKGSDFVKYAEQMISKNIRVNNEYYVCPVFNEAIQDQKRIGIFPVEEMWGLGTPEDLNHYLSCKKIGISSSLP